MYVKRRGFTLCKSGKLVSVLFRAQEFHIIKFSYKNNIFSIFFAVDTTQHNTNYALIMLKTYLIKIIFFFIITLLSFFVLFWCVMRCQTKKVSQL